MHASAAHQPTTTAAQHGEQQPGGLQHEDENESEQVPNYLTAKLLMRASQNIAKMHAAFNNEGPLRLKPLPSNVHDLANRWAGWVHSRVRKCVEHGRFCAILGPLNLTQVTWGSQKWLVIQSPWNFVEMNPVAGACLARGTLPHQSCA